MDVPDAPFLPRHDYGQTGNRDDQFYGVGTEFSRRIVAAESPYFCRSVTKLISAKIVPLRWVSRFAADDTKLHNRIRGSLILDSIV